MPNLVADLIDELGGRRVVADETGLKVGFIDQWKHRGRIPRTAWPELQKTFRVVTLDRLLAIEARAAERERAPA